LALTDLGRSRTLAREQISSVRRAVVLLGQPVKARLAHLEVTFSTSPTFVSVPAPGDGYDHDPGGCMHDLRAAANDFRVWIEVLVDQLVAADAGGTSPSS
jgi:hypothetical protein